MHFREMASEAVTVLLLACVTMEAPLLGLK